MSEINGKPSDSLQGLDLGNGWVVKELIKKTPAQTGGSFSSGYIVEDQNGHKGFLKAVDFSSAMQSVDIMKSLQDLTQTYNFEKEIVYKCKNRRLSKVILPICDGSITVSGFAPFTNKVFYIIFELADSDIRKVVSEFTHFDLAFCLRSLHNTAVGLEQLHKNDIAHQDLKPSNVLVTDARESKVSDLGRSSDKSKPFLYDNMAIPGDPNYAPFEQAYDYHISQDFQEKFAADLYHFGSLFFFFFSGVSARQATISAVLNNVGRNFAMTGFKKDLPLLEQGFADALIDLHAIINKISSKISNEIVGIANSLCQPDPEKRGHPKNVSTNINKYSLERYISKLDILAKKAEHGLI